jgi:hypothetical protein
MPAATCSAAAGVRGKKGSSQQLVCGMCQLLLRFDALTLSSQPSEEEEAMIRGWQVEAVGWMPEPAGGH